MSELRYDPITREWVIIAPERARRPHQPLKPSNADKLPDWDESCPFCPGNESQTPPEVFRLPLSDKASTWEVRVIPNRFAALMPEGSITRREDGRFFRKMDGIGAHEVIIESPSHNITTALMSYEQVQKILIAYQERYNALKKNRQFKFISIFKNHGQASGTSLIHPHSQLIATPILAPYYHRRLDVAVDYYAVSGSCLYCELLAEELKKGERIVAQTKEFVVFHPYASRTPWETWIIPKKHYASFGLTITEDEENPYYHWHIRIVPRLNLIAGFEMGSGIYISTALPEETTKLMKQVAQSFPEDECLSLKQKA